MARQQGKSTELEACMNISFKPSFRRRAAAAPHQYRLRRCCACFDYHRKQKCDGSADTVLHIYHDLSSDSPCTHPVHALPKVKYPFGVASSLHSVTVSLDVVARSFARSLVVAARSLVGRSSLGRSLASPRAWSFPRRRSSSSLVVGRCFISLGRAT